jgi:hypothetical protein
LSDRSGREVGDIGSWPDGVVNVRRGSKDAVTLALEPGRRSPDTAAISIQRFFPMNKQVLEWQMED